MLPTGCASQSQRVAAERTTRHERHGASRDRRNVGDRTPGQLAERQYRRGEENGSRNLYQVAERKEQNEKQKPAARVPKHELAHECDVEVIAQAGKLNDREQHAQKEDDREQPPMAQDENRDEAADYQNSNDAWTTGANVRRCAGQGPCRSSAARCSGVPYPL